MIDKLYQLKREQKLVAQEIVKDCIKDEGFDLGLFDKGYRLSVYDNSVKSNNGLTYYIYDDKDKLVAGGQVALKSNHNHKPFKWWIGR